MRLRNKGSKTSKIVDIRAATDHRIYGSDRFMVFESWIGLFFRSAKHGKDKKNSSSDSIIY